MAQIRALNLHEEDIDGPGDARTWVCVSSWRIGNPGEIDLDQLAA